MFPFPMALLIKKKDVQFHIKYMLVVCLITISYTDNTVFWTDELGKDFGTKPPSLFILFSYVRA